MRKIEEKTIKETYLVRLICNKCKKEVDIISMEAEEFLIYDYTGGFTSVFGDGVSWELDLCQDCVKELLGKYIKIKEEEYDF